MAEPFKRIEAITRVPIGKLNGPSASIYKAIESQGLPLPHREWVSQLRSGRSLGRQQLIRMELGSADHTDLSKKDKLYRRIATEGVFIRTFSDEQAYIPRYSSNGLVEAIADNLGFEGGHLRYFLAAMRADLVFGYTESEHDTFFLETAEAFLYANTEGKYPSRRKDGLVRMNEEWDRRSPLTFYKALYSSLGGGTKGLAAWVPYEIAGFQRFYDSRTLKRKASPTPFDQRVFEVRNSESAGNLVRDIREQTDIRVNTDTIVVHRNALVYGQPTSGLFD